MPLITEIDVTIEVTAAEVLKGFKELHGTIGHDEEHCQLKYYAKKLLGGTTEDEIIQIALKDIQDVSYKKNKIFLHPKRLNILKDIPGSHRDRLIFKVKKADRRYIEPFVTSLRSAVYEAAEEGLDSVPFKLEDTNMGLTENWGLLYMEDEFLVFDIQSGLKDVFKGERQVVKVEPKALNQIRLKHGSSRDILYIRPKKTKLLDVIPGEFKSEIKLKIKKRHRPEAERLVQRVVNWSF